MESNWQLELNVAGVRPQDAGGVDLPTGAYEAKTISTERRQSKEPGKADHFRFDVQIQGGEYDGVTQLIVLGSDLSKDGNKRSWRTAAQSHGYGPETLDRGQVTVGPSSFAGKRCFIYVQAAENDEKYADRRFITPERYALLKKDAANGASPTLGQTAAPVAQSAKKGVLASLLGQ